MEIVEEVHNKLLKEKKRLAVAESCTGGLLLATLTELPFASEYLLGGVVSYSNELKNKILHVSEQTLKSFGAVSKEVAIEMCEGLFEVTSAELAISVTGILGPSGGTLEKPIGTVWMAIGRRDQVIESRLIPLAPNHTRREYRDFVLKYLLEALWNL
ncbi:MAG: CinA family protein [Chlamydiae bacterium]|nr:CinA family protein [Chlamydiota bacterium]